MPPATRKIYLPAILLFFILLWSPDIFGSTQVLRNEMPPHLVPFQKTVERQARDFPEFFFLSNPKITEKKAVLTFDDGPDGEFTPAILDILREKEVKATFFLLGENVNQFPGITLKIHQEGHLIGNHSMTHTNFQELEVREIIEQEIIPTEEAIYRITGEKPVFIRPPYGSIQDEAIKALGKKGYRIVNWSVDSFDWDRELNKPEAIIERVLSYLHPGDVILMHSAGGNRENTVAALPEIIDALREKGYSLTTIDKLLSP